jgi:branched-chain amino acid aminotransferase
MNEMPYKLWFNGKLVDWNDANVHVMTHTLHYGLGVFEGIRAYECEEGKTAIFRLSEHVERLFTSAHIAKIKIPYSREEITEAILKTIKENKLVSCYIRPLVFIGDGVMGVHPRNNPIHVIIAVWPWGAYLGDDGITNGIRAKVSSYTRMHINASMTKAKICGNYVNSIYAKVEATSLGYDEAILLDTDGYVAEGSGENIFIVRRGKLKTPPLTSTLEGITRNTVIEIAEDEGIEIEYQRFTRDEFYIADESFMTGTAAEVTPIRELDDRVIGSGKPGEVTKRLQHIFFETVKGKNKKYKKWLTYLPA